MEMPQLPSNSDEIILPALLDLHERLSLLETKATTMTTTPSGSPGYSALATSKKRP